MAAQHPLFETHFEISFSSSYRGNHHVYAKVQVFCKGQNQEKMAEFDFVGVPLTQT